MWVVYLNIFKFLHRTFSCQVFRFKMWLCIQYIYNHCFLSLSLASLSLFLYDYDISIPLIFSNINRKVSPVGHQRHLARERCASAASCQDFGSSMG